MNGWEGDRKDYVNETIGRHLNKVRKQQSSRK